MQLARRLRSLVVVLAIAGSTHPAWVSIAAAEEAPATASASIETDRASALFREGRRLVDEQRYGEACERFEQSYKLSAGLGTRFNLADCWEHIGRIASAQAAFTEVAIAAHAAGQIDRETLARERAAALEARVSRVTIDVQVSPGEQPTVLQNGSLVKAEHWGKALPVDPGTQVIEVTAPGRLPWTSRVQVPSGGAMVWVTVPRLLEDPKAHPISKAPVAAKKKKPARKVPEEKPRDMRAVSLGLAALGVSGIAAGTAFALKYKSFADDADAICPSLTAPCSEEDSLRRDSLDSDAEATGTGAIISFSVGGAALLGAFISHFVFDTRRKVSRERQETRLQFTPVVGGHGLGLVGQGAF
jgi:hypothetical protein